MAAGGSAVPVAVAAGYGGLALGMSLVHNVMLLYHVDAYTHVFGIPHGHFVAAELVFLLYNSLNDFIWGWLSDSGPLGATKALKDGQGTRAAAAQDVVHRRLRCVHSSAPCAAGLRRVRSPAHSPHRRAQGPALGRAGHGRGLPAILVPFPSAGIALLPEPGRL
jgi:hypothetical protein